MRRFARIGIAAIMAATPVAFVGFTATPAQAYCLKEISRWQGDRHSLYAGRSIPKSWRQAIAAANGQWNGIHGSKLTYGRVHWKGTGRYRIARVDFAKAGLPDAPGITIGVERHGKRRHGRATVMLNRRFHWNTTGRMDQHGRMADVWTVAVHEMGHASGLSHPWACGRMTKAERTAVMNATWKAKHHPNSDDKAGIARLY